MCISAKAVFVAAALALGAAPVYGQPFDLTGVLKSKPELSDDALTRACKAEPATANTLCQGNEGKFSLKSASIETRGNIHLKAIFRQTNRHVLTAGVVLYDSSSDVIANFEIGTSCQIIKKSIEGDNAYLKIANAILSLSGQNVADIAVKHKAIPGC